MGSAPTIGEVERLIPRAEAAVAEHTTRGGALEGLSPQVGIGIRPEFNGSVGLVLTIDPSVARVRDSNWPKTIDGAVVHYEFDVIEPCSAV